MSGFSHNKERRRANSLAPGMSRHDNIWDNVVAESFFDLLKKERIRKGSTKLAIWPAPISSITLKCSEIRPGIIASPGHQSVGLRTGFSVRTGSVYC